MHIMKNSSKEAWKRLFKKYFDLNNDGKISWVEIAVPILLLLFIEVLAELISSLLIWKIF